MVFRLYEEYINGLYLKVIDYTNQLLLNFFKKKVLDYT